MHCSGYLYISGQDKLATRSPARPYKMHSTAIMLGVNGDSSKPYIGSLFLTLLETYSEPFGQPYLEKRQH